MRNFEILFVGALQALLLSGCDDQIGECSPDYIGDLPTKCTAEDTSDVLMCAPMSAPACIGMNEDELRAFVGELNGRHDCYVAEVLCGPVWVAGTCCAHVYASGPAMGMSGDGRPFTVGQQTRVAEIMRRADWMEPVSPAKVPEAAREALAQRWAQAGQAEHASVASFARFALVLMHHGAPAALIAGAHAAALDEVGHSKICFSFATAYGGAAVGPGPLDTHEALGELDAEKAVEALVLEGCVGETLAAMEVAVGGRGAQDPFVASALKQIAADEQRHAAFAWACLAWFLEQRPELWAAADAAFASALARPVARPAAPDLQAYGFVGPDQRAEIAAAGARLIREAWGTDQRAAA